MKKLVMVCVLGIAFAFLMSGCSSCPSWCPFAPSKDKATCACCDKGAACTCAKDGKDACACCKDGAACKCDACKPAICKCCSKPVAACTCAKDGKDACTCCKDGGTCKCDDCKPDTK